MSVLIYGQFYGGLLIGQKSWQHSPHTIILHTLQEAEQLKTLGFKLCATVTTERLMPKEISESDLNMNELSEKYACCSSVAVSQPWQGATNELKLKCDKVSDLLKPGQALPWWDILKNKPDLNVKITLHKQGSCRKPSKPKPKGCHHRKNGKMSLNPNFYPFKFQMLLNGKPKGLAISLLKVLYCVMHILMCPSNQFIRTQSSFPVSFPLILFRRTGMMVQGTSASLLLQPQLLWSTEPESSLLIFQTWNTSSILFSSLFLRLVQCPSLWIAGSSRSPGSIPSGEGS